MERRLAPPLLLEEVSEVEAGLEVDGIDAQHVLVGRACRSTVSPVVVERAEVAVGVGEVGLELDGASGRPPWPRRRSPTPRRGPSRVRTRRVRCPRRRPSWGRARSSATVASPEAASGVSPTSLKSSTNCPPGSSKPSSWRTTMCPDACTRRFGSGSSNPGACSRSRARLRRIRTSGTPSSSIPTTPRKCTRSRKPNPPSPLSAPSSRRRSAVRSQYRSRDGETRRILAVSARL